MTREQAESRRDELAREQPEVTWIAAESGGEWQVVKIGMPPANAPSGTEVAGRPRPERPDSPPAPDNQIHNPNWGV